MKINPLSRFNRPQRSGIIRNLVIGGFFFILVVLSFKDAIVSPEAQALRDSCTGWTDRILLTAWALMVDVLTPPYFTTDSLLAILIMAIIGYITFRQAWGIGMTICFVLFLVFTWFQRDKFGLILDFILKNLRGSMTLLGIASVFYVWFRFRKKKQGF